MTCHCVLAGDLVVKSMLSPSPKLMCRGCSTVLATCHSRRRKMSGDDHWGLERPGRLLLKRVVSVDKCALGSVHMRETPFLPV